MHKPSILGIIVALGALTSSPARAADDLASATTSIAIACSGVDVATEIRREQLAEAVLVMAGMRPSDLLQLVTVHKKRAPSAAELSSAALDLVRDTHLLPVPVARQVEAITAVLEDTLSHADGDLVGKLVVRGIASDQSPFDDGLALICPGKTKIADIKGAIVSTKKPVGHEAGTSRFILRQKLEDATVDAKDASGSFQGMFARERSTDLDGQTSRTTTVSVDGVAAVRVVGDTKKSYLFGYADYSLSHVRKSSYPEPTPDAKSGRDDDVDALELGAYGSFPISLGGFDLRTSGRLGAVLDFEHDARRLVGGLRFQPVLSRELRPAGTMLCGIGFYSRQFLGLPLEARCSAAFRIEASEVLKAGTAKLTDKDQLLALGGEVALEFRPQLLGGTPADGFVGGITYRYQKMVAGQAPSIDRVDIAVKYRWWLDKLAVDFGFSFADGTEVKSFADENKLGATLGVLF